MLGFHNAREVSLFLDQGIILTQVVVSSVGFFDSSADVLKTAALFLAVLLPTIGTIWTLRSQMAKAGPAANPTVGAAGLAVIAGGIASQQDSRLYIEEFQQLTASVDRLTASQSMTAEAYEEGARRWKDALDELEGIRRALEESVTLLRQRPSAR